jgi:hypothetical protein
MPSGRTARGTIPRERHEDRHEPLARDRRLTVSIGLTISKAAGDTPSHMLQRADAALYEAKRAAATASDSSCPSLRLLRRRWRVRPASALLPLLALDRAGMSHMNHGDDLDCVVDGHDADQRTASVDDRRPAKSRQPQALKQIAEIVAFCSP